MSDLPFRAEYAKSNRSSCKACKMKIEKDHLRLAIMVQSPMFDGKTPHWYHFQCFFGKKTKLRNVGDISHFESLRWEDQEKIRKKIEGNESPAGNEKESESSKKSASKRKASESDDFAIEYAKSGKATCHGCETIIVKGDIRVGEMEYDSEKAMRFGAYYKWHHLDCFEKLRQQMGYTESGKSLKGFNLLSENDRTDVEKKLPKIITEGKGSDEVDAKKPKLENEKDMKKQNKFLFRYRDCLKALKKKELVLLFEKNDQAVPSGNDNMLDRLADGMAFGALELCDECQGGQLVFRSGIGYFCLGNKDEWSKCERVYENPKRRTFKISSELKKKYPFLDSYKCKVQKRLFQGNYPSVSHQSSSSTGSNFKSTGDAVPSRPKIERKLPLLGMEFAIGGKLSKKKEELKREVLKLGGSLGNSVHSHTMAIFATPKSVEKMNTAMKAAESFQIEVIPEEFLEQVRGGANPIAVIKRSNIAPWSSTNPESRIKKDQTDGNKKSHRSTSMYSLDKESRKLKVVDGSAVDPDSGMQDTTHVYKSGKDVYSIALSLTDVQSGKNSYYKLQVLESDSSFNRGYWVFRSWGRIGTTIGGTKLDKLELDEAVAQFEALYEEKTANMWAARKSFHKVPGKMVPLDITYEDEEKIKNLESNIPSKLEKPIQALVSLIFNVDTMKNVMLEFELDLEKMPLGKLSKKQLQKAFGVLTQLQNAMGDGETKEKPNQGMITSLTNQFYTLVPHNFGMGMPPMIDNTDMMRQKVEMVEALLDMELAYSIMNATCESGQNHIDAHYSKLNTKIEILEEEAPEFEILKLYVKNTHAETHTQYGLEIARVYKISREGEEKRFKPFKKLHNRKLLWHGSRITNYAGILSKGLRIAPPEAPVTGYMFGKGIYFADMVSKSAQYCFTNSVKNTGLLLLCEVALGNMHECLQATDIRKLPKGKHSCKGVGETYPNPEESHAFECGLEVPCGKPIKGQRHTLLYNEYIVYDVAQVQCKYLVEMKFNYNSLY